MTSIMNWNFNTSNTFCRYEQIIENTKELSMRSYMLENNVASLVVPNAQVPNIRWKIAVNEFIAAKVEFDAGRLCDFPSAYEKLI